MSQLEVDKIIPQSGTTLTIGDSGDTITFADGAVIGIDTDTLYIDSTNNRVGIGTSSPLGKLHIQDSSAANTQIAIENTAAATSTDYRIVAGKVGVSNEGFSIYDSANTTTAYYIDSSGNHEFLGGNVGIGTSSPATTLDVQGGNITQGATGSNAGRLLIDNTTDTIQRIKISRGGSTGQLAFHTGTDSEAMRIDSSGRVGIGTSSPLGKFKVNVGDVAPAASGDMNTGVIIESGYGSRTINIGTNNTGGYSWINAAFSNNSGVADNLVLMTGATERMRIDSSGVVGIGTTTPSTGYGGTISNVKLALRNDGAGGNNGTSTLLIGGDNNHYSYLLSEHTGGGATYLAFGTAGGTSNPVERMRIDSSGNVLIGGTSTSALDGVSGIVVGSSTASTAGIAFESSAHQYMIYSGSTNDSLLFYDSTNDTERMRIKSNGEICTGLPANYGTDPTSMTGVGKSNMSDQFSASSNLKIARSGDAGIQINRCSDDGNLMIFRQDGTNEGTISVSGATVAYNGFTGTHWSRLTDNSKPTILKGTILESLDEMMDWYQITFNLGEDGDENIIKLSYTLQESQSVGDVITYNYNTHNQDENGDDIFIEVQATIIKEGDIKHSKCKISDTSESKAVYGVFVSYDEDDDNEINDIYIAQTGTFVVRINSNQTVSKGDLIQSNGDGTGKVQADDIIRSSTVAKVLSTTKIETYEDGSYIVPCSLHC